MAQRLVSDEHIWLAAATIELDDEDARQAQRRGYYRVRHDTRVDVVDMYCKQCHRYRAQVEGKPCEAAASNKHLIGGPVEDIRAKRNHDHDCTLIGCKPNLPALRAAVGFQ